MTYPPTFRIQITQLVTTRLMISTRLMILFVLVAGINKVDSVAAQGVTGTPILIQQPVGVRSRSSLMVKPRLLKGSRIHESGSGMTFGFRRSLTPTVMEPTIEFMCRLLVRSRPKPRDSRFRSSTTQVLILLAEVQLNRHTCGTPSMKSEPSHPNETSRLRSHSSRSDQRFPVNTPGIGFLEDTPLCTLAHQGQGFRRAVQRSVVTMSRWLPKP